MDLIQAGNEGLLKAIKYYQISNNTGFINYAYPIIYQSIVDEINNHSYLIKIPRYAKEKLEEHELPKIKKSLNQYDDEKETEELDKYPQYIFPSPLQYALKQEKDKIIKTYLNGLRPEGKNMIILYFGLYGNKKHTYEQIGKLYNISKSAVYQNITKQLEILTDISEYFTEFKK